MRTTFNLDEQLLIAARHRAVEESVSLARVIENALRESIAEPRAMRETIQLITASGPGVYSTQTGHRFHGKLDTHSTRTWTVGA